MPLELARIIILTLYIQACSSSKKTFGLFDGVIFHDCYDGDTCKFTIPGLHPLFGEKINARLFGVDTPELKGSSCVQERTIAIEARDFVRGVLSKGTNISLQNVRRDKYFRILCDILVDGVSVSQLLLDANLAYPYTGGSKYRYYWCKAYRDEM